MPTIRIATRNSPLALWQARFVEAQLKKAHPDLDVETIGMTTKGDQLLDRALSKVGGKGLFLKELEIALLNDEADIAVHSMKDVPVEMPIGLEIACVCERADPRDAFVSNEYDSIDHLPSGARVGTSSLRRSSQLKYAFAELEFVELRGNVNTRLRKLDEGEYDAIILAAAGLERLEMQGRIAQYLSPALSLPAVGQGVIGIECRSDDQRVKQLLSALHHEKTAICLQAERTMNAALEGGCQVPVAGFAQISGDRLQLKGMVASLDGKTVLKANSETQLDEAQTLGKKVAAELLDQGAAKILRAVNDTGVKHDLPIVLLTRQHEYLGNMSAMLSSLDYEPVHVPAMAVSDIEDSSLESIFSNLNSYTDVVFVSKNAVAFGMELIDQYADAIPSSIRVMTVGSETARLLYQHGVDSLFPTDGYGSLSLMQASQLEDMSGRKVLIIRGVEGLDWLEMEMLNRGAEVENAICYRTELPVNGASKLLQALQQHDVIHSVFFHSVQNAANIIEMAGDSLDKLAKAKAITGSQRIADYVEGKGWSGEVFVATSPSNKHMMMCLAKMEPHPGIE